MKNKTFKKITALILLTLILCLSVRILGTRAQEDQPEQAPEQGKPDITEAFEAISNLRVYVEFYFIETAEYPQNLKVLNQELNSLLPSGVDRVIIPRDPATGKDFKYQVSEDRKSYTLSLPKPSAYGVDELKLSNVPWGGYAKIAEARKQLFLRTVCYKNIKGIATAVEYYAKDHNGNFPRSLDDLSPEYIQVKPTCPVSKQEYIYKTKDGNYSISCPNPHLHGMRNLLYSTDKGWVTR